MSDNSERRLEAKRKLEERLAVQEAAARRRKRITIGVAGVVVIALVATGVSFGVIKYLDHRDKENFASCSYKKADPAQDPLKTPPPIPSNLAPDQEALAKQYQQRFIDGKSKQRTAELPNKREHRKGTLDGVFATSQGDVPFTLKRPEATCNVAAIESLINNKYYDNTSCHRLTDVDGGSLTILQCGDPTETGAGTPGWTSPDEFPTNLKAAPQDPQQAAMGAPETVIYPRGTIAIANGYRPSQSGEVQGANTGAAQLFMVIRDSQLPPNYSVVGSISEPGLTVLDKVAAGGINGVPTPSQTQTGAVVYQPTPGDGAPKLPVTITKATIS